jgi:hypothetical protein
MVVEAPAAHLDAYMVAAYPSRRGSAIDEQPQGKRHAYLEGARSTVCGFGLGEMRRFTQLRYSDQDPTVRCFMCERIVRAAAR